jgi:hypothetical protein
MIISTDCPTPTGLVDTLTYAKVGMVRAAFAVGTSMIEADIETINNKAIAIAPVLLLKGFTNLFDICFSPFSVVNGVKYFCI